MLPIIALCLSVIPLDHGDLPAVDKTSILSNSAISLYSSLLNSPPLSLRNQFGVPNRAIQCLNIRSIITSLCLDVMIAAALNLVALSIK